MVIRGLRAYRVCLECVMCHLFHPPVGSDGEQTVVLALQGGSGLNRKRRNGQ